MLLIPVDATAGIWPLAAPFIEKACKHDRAELITADEHRDAIFSGQRQLWVVWTDESEVIAAGITEIIKDTCFVWAFAGEQMHRWFPLHTVVENWAKSKGCNGVRLIGRQGWERLFGRHGYERRFVVMHKDF